MAASAQLAARPVAAPSLPDPQSFEAVVALIGEKREVGLQMDVQRYVRPVAFKPGAITYESLDGAPIDWPASWPRGSRTGPAAPG